MKRIKLFVFCLVLYTGIKYTSARTLPKQESWPSSLANEEDLPYVSNARFSNQQTETIEVGNINLPEAALIKQASDAGMDSVAVAELLRTREPVIITKTDASGRRLTTTYRLTDSGGISSRTVTEGHGPSFDVNTRGNFELPSSLSAAPTTSVSTNAADPRKVENDWEWASVPKTNTRTYTISGTRPFSFGSPFGSDVNDDDFFKPQPRPRPRPAQGSTTTTFGEIPDSWRNRDWLKKPGFELPPGAKPKVTTTTEIDDQGRKITTTKTVYSTLPHDQWPDNSFPSLFGNDDNWQTIGSGLPRAPKRPSSVLPESDIPKTTTQRSILTFHDEFPRVFNNQPRAEVDDDNFLGTTPKTLIPHNPKQPGTPTITSTNPNTRINVERPRPALPSFDEWKRQFLTTSTTHKPFIQIDDHPNVKTTTPLPSLEDFLKTQYGGNTTIFTYDLNSFTTTPRTVKINIDELPNTSTTTTTTTTKKVKNEIKPLIEDFWLQEPYVTTTTKVNNFGPDEEDSVLSTKSGTKVSTLSKTVTSNGLPAVADLDSNMQEILIKAGITDEDLRNSNGQRITKTRVAPDGRVIKTTYVVQSLPQESTFENRVVLQQPQTFTVRRQHDLQLPSLDANAERSYSHKQERATFPESTNSVPNDKFNSIDRFLANVNLSPEEISSKQGEVTKTLIDDNGRVLSATFVLSTVKGDSESERENAARELEPVK